MSAVHPVTAEEYLHTTYAPDVDFVEGELQERNRGEYDHGAVQAALIGWFRARRTDWGIRVIPELRVQITPTRFRVPDVVVLDRESPKEQIIQTAPILCIEVLSPEDRVSRFGKRLEEYLTMGVKAVWVIDPQTAKGYNCPAGDFAAWVEQQVLTVPGTDIRLDVRELFADLD